jgi:hypothetical protein
MGGTKSKLINYYIIGDDDHELIERMFAKYKEIKPENHLILKKYAINNFKITDKIQLDVNWEINFLSQIDNNNQIELLQFLIKELKLKSPIDKTTKEESRKTLSNNVLIKFGNKNIENLVKLLNIQTTVSLPQFAIFTESNFKYEFNYPRFLEIINVNKVNFDDLQKKLFSYMIERDGYYNERWDKCLELSPNLILTTKNISNAKLNILLIGITRCGKSTFVNLFCNKMISLESPENESITSKISEYPFYIKGSDNNLIQINFTDTPGLTKIEDKDVDTIDLVKDLIEKKFKQCEDSKDDIHIIYFFSEPNSNLENIKRFFKYLIELNNKRLAKKKKKKNIIFIIKN